jgi:CRP-like cAMP-binding protein
VSVTSPPSATPNRLLRIPAAEFEQVAPHLERVSIRPREFFIASGDSLPHVYFPYSGVVSLVVGMQSGDSIEVATVGRHGMLGISVLLEADPAPYDMLCQVPGEAARLTSQTFIELTDRLPSFRRRLLRYALGLLHEVARTAACNRLHSVEQRLARWLLLCGDQVEADAFPLTHEALARALGARRPYITRVARVLQQSGVIQYHRGTLRILDRGRLEAVSCEDYRDTRREYTRLLG